MKKFFVFVVMIAMAFGVVMAVRSRLGTVPSKDSPQSSLYYCPMHPTYTSDRPGDCPICSMALVKREPTAAPDSTERPIVYWTDPMIPGYRSDKPGKSPMGMDLVPVYEDPTAPALSADAPEGYAPIRLTEGKQQLIGVKTALAQRSPMTRTIRTVGTVAYDPALYQAEAEHLQAVRALERIADKGQSLAGTVPEETLGPARALVESTRLRLQLLGLSPTLIEEMAVGEGPDRRLLLADPGGRVWVYATVYEFELPFVAVGQTAIIEIPAAPGRAFEGEIRAMDPVVDAATRSTRVRIELTDPDGLLKPAMFVNAMLRVALGDRLTVPASAVMATGTRHVVFVARDNGVLEPRDVTVGARAEDAVEIVSGVVEGESVVTSGNFLIDSESRLKAALDGMSPSTGSGQAGGHQHGQ